MADKKQDENQPVTLVALEAFSPYKKGEVFTVPRKQADLILTADPRRENEFGQVYPQVKVREYDPDQDEHLLKTAGIMTQKEQEVFEAKHRAQKESKLSKETNK